MDFASGAAKSGLKKEPFFKLSSKSGRDVYFLFPPLMFVDYIT